jgi:methylated-DNA-[protein]-cysteine S-methyltransferase
MIYTKQLESPIGSLTLVANDDGLCGMYFPGHKPAPKRDSWQEGESPWLAEGEAWLKEYFAGKQPQQMPPLVINHGTAFQRSIWAALKVIPRGETRTYAQLAQQIGSPKAVRAVGSAVGRNPHSIFVPCHRVVGSNGSLTGFAGGVERKLWLLKLEQTAAT